MLRRIAMIYEDMYSALYHVILKSWHGDDYMASFMSACALGGAAGLNIGLGIGVVRAMYFADAAHPIIPTWIVTIVFLLVAYGLYAAFLRGDRYQQVVRRFQCKPASSRRRIAVITWIYVAASF